MLKTEQASTQDDIDPITMMAAQWFALLRENPSEQQQAEFDAWLEQDARHKAAYQALEQIWQQSALLPLEKQRSVTPSHTTGKHRSRLSLGLALAAVLAMLVIGLNVILPGAGNVDYQTGIGEVQRFTLSDGSVVEMSADTAIDIQYTDTARIIKLLKGEAWFQVQPNQHKPFTVIAGEGRVTALGTAFAVAHKNQQTDVVVTEHRVRVALGKKTLTQQSVELTQGHKVYYTNKVLGEVQQADLDIELAWRQGRLVFINQPLSHVLMELEQWLPGYVVLMDEQMASRPITIMSDIQRRDTLLTSLTQVAPLKLVQLSPYLTLVYAQ